MIGYPIRFVTRGSLDTDKDFTDQRYIGILCREFTEHQKLGMK